MRPVLPFLPKGLAPVMGRPFLSYILDKLELCGTKRTILCTGYMGDVIRKNMGSKYGNMDIIYSHEPEPLDTGGALRLALPYINTEAFLVINGDTYIDSDFSGFLENFESTGVKVGIMLVHKKNTERYGRVSVDSEGAVLRFSEKGKFGDGWVSAGAYLFKRSVFMDIPEGCPLSLENEIFPSMIGKGLSGFCSGAEMIDIGTSESYQKAEQFFIAIERENELHR